MKKILFTTLLLSIALTSCSEKKETESTQNDSNIIIEESTAGDNESDTTKNTASTSSSGNGLQLIEKADCFTCHRIDSKLIGPAYQDVAAKYSEADIDYLSEKIINGGGGIWGDIPMSAHVGMNKGDAEEMVKYILSLKK